MHPDKIEVPKRLRRVREHPPQRSPICWRQTDMDKRTCGAEGCSKPVKTGGYCGRHYENLRLRGSLIPRKEWPLEMRLRDIGWTITPAGCWEWNGKRNKYNYGRFTAKGLGISETMAHRVMYEFFIGPIPDGLLVRHKCDNPPCVNPAHLLVGTYQDNVNDMMERGRCPLKVSVEQRRQIRLRWAAGEMQKQIAIDYGISQQHVSYICRTTEREAS
jgi:HNH endonuclease